MNLISLVGRVLLVLVFIVSGASKLLDIQGTAQEIASKVILPQVVAPYTAQIETLTSMSMPQLLAIVAGLVELICAVMIIFNLGARFFAVVLILFTVVTTFYFHDFWQQTGPAYAENLAHALKNLCVVGALLLIVSWPRQTLSEEPAYEHDIMRH